MSQRSGEAGDVLVIKLGALGDVILSLPHLTRIKESFPQSRVTLLTAPEYRELVALVPGLEVVAFPRKGFIAMFQVMRWLLGRRFRLVFDLQGSTRSRIMTLLTQAEQRVGRKAGTSYTHVPADQDDGMHAFQRLNALLDVAGVMPAAQGMPDIFREQSSSAVSAWLEKHVPGDKKRVLMHAGSSRRWQSKRWEEACFIDLARQLEACDFSVIWIGGQDDREVNQRLSKTVGVDASGVFSYIDLIDLGCHAAFAITNDSGPMHLLSLSGIPVYAFFGSTDWRRSHALDQREHILINPVPCSPCFLSVCPPEHRHECLVDIAPDSVFARLQADKLV
jgi:ADP-heptose:LPS heptosyltransferase